MQELCPACRPAFLLSVCWLHSPWYWFPLKYLAHCSKIVVLTFHILQHSTPTETLSLPQFQKSQQSHCIELAGVSHMSIPLLITVDMGMQHSVQSTQLCPTLWNPMDCSMPGLPVHHQLLEFTQTHIHWVGDAIQPSYPLSSPCPPAFNLSQHQGLFKWVSSLHQVAKVLEFQLQPQSFQWTPRTDFL